MRWQLRSTLCFVSVCQAMLGLVFAAYSARVSPSVANDPAGPVAMQI